ncbi:MAG: hypothetical protein EXS42_05825 [Lacunisphaera sp.]|nr:hypothetical protein [Lacunisphaera sp.]
MRILRAADARRSIGEFCQEKNISKQTFPRWKRQFSMRELPEACVFSDDFRQDCN